MVYGFKVPDFTPEVDFEEFPKLLEITKAAQYHLQSAENILTTPGTVNKIDLQAAQAHTAQAQALLAYGGTMALLIGRE